jgi:hypothetical protein
MDINKAIRKQKKSYNRFMLAMCFIFFMLPIVTFISGKANAFFIAYLGILEILILIALILRSNNEKLNYSWGQTKLKIKFGLFGKMVSISYDRVVLVHIDESSGDAEVILIMTTNLKNIYARLVSKNFLQRYSTVSQEYTRIKKLYPEEDYYYIVFKNGGFLKYKLLIQLYKNCVKAVYTSEAIECIKKWKNT